MAGKDRSITVGRSKLLLIVAFVLFVLYVIGIFATWSGQLYSALPWTAFAVWVLALLI
jgi:hypothetical protein